MILDEIGAFIATSLPATLGTDLFYGRMPDAPTDCIAIFEYGGARPEDTFGGSLPVYETPRIQVLVRAIKYSDARMKSEKVYRALHGIAETTLSGVRYLRIQARESPFFLRRDENTRVYIACNYEVWKELSPVV